MAAKQGNAYAIQRLDSLKTGTSSGRTPVANLDWADVVELVKPGVVLIQTDEGLGTGFFISNNQIITNHHVVVDSEEIEPARRISVKQFNSDLEFARGRVILATQDRDIAVLTLSNIPTTSPTCRPTFRGKQKKSAPLEYSFFERQDQPGPFGEAIGLISGGNSVARC